MSIIIIINQNMVVIPLGNAISSSLSQIIYHPQITKKIKINIYIYIHIFVLAQCPNGPMYRS